MTEKRYKACLFDMDGLLLNTEDFYTELFNEILQDYNIDRPLSWDFKIKLQGRPAPEAAALILAEYDLPLTAEEYMKLNTQKLSEKWGKSKFLDGALELLQKLHANDVPIALGTSSHKGNFEGKTGHLQHGFELFNGHIVTGDDPRIPPGRGKPHPDIWKACLDSLNKDREEKILPHECLVLEDGLPGVEAGKAFSSFVVWVPHANALKTFNGKEKEILDGSSGIILASLADLDIDSYIRV